MCRRIPFFFTLLIFTSWPEYINMLRIKFSDKICFFFLFYELSHSNFLFPG